MLIDTYSRYTPHCIAEEHESANMAVQFIADAIERNGPRRIRRPVRDLEVLSRFAGRPTPPKIPQAVYINETTLETQID